jgi:hypothetical protein
MDQSTTLLVPYVAINERTNLSKVGKKKSIFYTARTGMIQLQKYKKHIDTPIHKGLVQIFEENALLERLRLLLLIGFAIEAKTRDRKRRWCGAMRSMMAEKGCCVDWSG